MNRLEEVKKILRGYHINEVDFVAYQITQLFTPKSEDGLLSEEIICVLNEKGSAHCGKLTEESLAKIASIKDAEWQKRLRDIRRKVEQNFEPTIPMSISYEKWWELWQQEGIQE